MNRESQGDFVAGPPESGDPFLTIRAAVHAVVGRAQVRRPRLTAANREKRKMRVSNGTQVARPVRTTVTRGLAGRYLLGWWARPVHDDYLPRWQELAAR